jgi:hypothetical protein
MEWLEVLWECPKKATLDFRNLGCTGTAEVHGWWMITVKSDWVIFSNPTAQKLLHILVVPPRQWWLLPFSLPTLWMGTFHKFSLLVEHYVGYMDSWKYSSEAPNSYKERRDSLPLTHVNYSIFCSTNIHWVHT